MSDFVVDWLEFWWQENHSIYLELEELVIDLDAGAATHSNRTQFIVLLDLITIISV